MSYILKRALYLARDICKGIYRLYLLEDLDKYFLHVENCFSISSDKGLEALNKIRFVDKKTPYKDPFSDEYRQYQMDLYFKISGNSSYQAFQNEKSEINVDEAIRIPFPYSTRSNKTVGDYLMGLGFLIKNFELPPGSRILEIGAGWGESTLALIRMGYDVSIVEVDPNMAMLIRNKTSAIGFDIEINQCDMLDFKTQKEFEGVLFFDSFHHCSDHAKMVSKLEKLIVPHGKVIFAAEPITIFPIPWGLRLDGLSLWSIRKNGWLELGYDISYFKKLLRNNGWNVRSVKSSISNFSNVYIARRMDNAENI